MAATNQTSGRERVRALEAIARLEGARRRLEKRPVDAGESATDMAIRLGIALVTAAVVAYAIWDL